LAALLARPLRWATAKSGARWAFQCAPLHESPCSTPPSGASFRVPLPQDFIRSTCSLHGAPSRSWQRYQSGGNRRMTVPMQTPPTPTGHQSSATNPVFPYGPKPGSRPSGISPQMRPPATPPPSATVNDLPPGFHPGAAPMAPPPLARSLALSLARRRRAGVPRRRQARQHRRAAGDEGPHRRARPRAAAAAGPAATAARVRRTATVGVAVPGTAPDRLRSRARAYLGLNEWAESAAHLRTALSSGMSSEEQIERRLSPVSSLAQMILAISSL